jgi:endonuclease/exonuclease/phosphatase family metal-dependent hydrolase
MQLKCLFWNAGRNAPDIEIAALAVSTGANVIALAEYANDGNSLLHELTNQGLDFYLVPTIACDRIRLLTAFQPSHVTHGRESDRYTIKELVLPGLSKVLLCLAHLPSKLHANDVDQLHSAWYFKQDIESSESEAKHQNTIVLGDFNMNPFDDGMVAAAAMNSVPSLAVAQREKRIVQGRPHTFFYNPTWNLLGDFAGVPGTFFHASPGYLSHYWCMLDQVLLRPSIAERLDQTSLRILTEAGTSSLLSSEGRPKTSDHLPLYFSLNLI